MTISLSMSPNSDTCYNLCTFSRLLPSREEISKSTVCISGFYARGNKASLQGGHHPRLHLPLHL